MFTQYTSRIEFTQYTSRVVFTQYTSRTEFTQYTNRVVFTQYTSRTVFRERQVNTQAYQPSKTPTRRCPWRFPSQPSRETALTEMAVNPLSSAVRTFFFPIGRIWRRKRLLFRRHDSRRQRSRARHCLHADTNVKGDKPFLRLPPLSLQLFTAGGGATSARCSADGHVVTDLRCELGPTIPEKGTMPEGRFLPYRTHREKPHSLRRSWESEVGCRCQQRHSWKLK